MIPPHTPPHHPATPHQTTPHHTIPYHSSVGRPNPVHPSPAQSNPTHPPSQELARSISAKPSPAFASGVPRVSPFWPAGEPLRGNRTPPSSPPVARPATHRPAQRDQQRHQTAPRARRASSPARPSSSAHARHVGLAEGAATERGARVSHTFHAEGGPSRHVSPRGPSRSMSRPASPRGGGLRGSSPRDASQREEEMQTGGSCRSQSPRGGRRPRGSSPRGVRSGSPRGSASPRQRHAEAVEQPAEVGKPLVSEATASLRPQFKAPPRQYYTTEGGWSEV